MSKSDPSSSLRTLREWAVKERDYWDERNADRFWQMSRVVHQIDAALLSQRQTCHCGHSFESHCNGACVQGCYECDCSAFAAALLSPVEGRSTRTQTEEQFGGVLPNKKGG